MSFNDYGSHSQEVSNDEYRYYLGELREAMERYKNELPNAYRAESLPSNPTRYASKTEEEAIKLVVRPADLSPMTQQLNRECYRNVLARLTQQLTIDAVTTMPDDVMLVDRRFLTKQSAAVRLSTPISVLDIYEVDDRLLTATVLMQSLGMINGMRNEVLGVRQRTTEHFSAMPERIPEVPVSSIRMWASPPEYAANIVSGFYLQALGRAFFRFSPDQIRAVAKPEEPAAITESPSAA